MKSTLVPLSLFTAVVLRTSAEVLDTFVTSLFADYEKDIRPYCMVNGTSIPTHVYMDLSLRQIIDLDEPQQMLKINVWIRLSWWDCRLVWNDTGSYQVETIMVPQKKVWIPDLTLYDNSAASILPGLKDYVATVNDTGRLKYNFPSVINSMCAIDVRYFPFDYQSCSLEFGSWASPGSGINISALKESVDMENYIENIEWSVISTKAIRKEVQYETESYPSIIFKLSLRRKPLFYLMNMIFPCLLITFVAVFGFMLPPDSGEKVNLEVTVLLSLAVFQLIVLDLIPASGDSTPFIGIYFMTSMVLVGMSCLMTVIVLQIHFRGCHGRQISPWVYQHIMIPLARITFVQLQPDILLDRQQSLITRKMSLRPGKVYMNGAPAETFLEQSERQPFLPEMKEIISTVGKISANVDAITQIVCDSDEGDVIKLQWSILATIFDRLFLAVYVIVSVITTMSILLQFQGAQ